MRLLWSPCSPALRTARPSLVLCWAVVSTAVVSPRLPAQAPSPLRQAAAPLRQEGASPRRVTLDQALRLAERHNPTLREAAADLDASRADRLRAVGAFLPDVRAGYGFSTSSTGRLDPTAQAITNTSYTAQLTASYDLLPVLTRASTLSGSAREVEAARTRVRERRFLTRLETKTAFFAAVAARERVRVLEGRLERQEGQLDSVRIRMELGEVARAELLRSEVEANDARLELLRARNDARAARFGLGRTLGLREPVEPAPEERLDAAPPPASLERLRNVALRSAPSLAAARAEVEAAEARVTNARSAYLPDLTIGGGFAWQNQEFPPKNQSWAIFLSGSYPLFDGLRRESMTSRRQAEAEAARARLRAAELQVRATLDSAYLELETAREGIRLSRRGVELSREDLAVSRERFRLGRAAILELQTAQSNLSEAELDLIRARFDYRLALARLEYLLGTDLRADRARSPARDADVEIDSPGARR